MQEKKVEYGTTHDVTVQSADKHAIVLTAEVLPGEAFVLLYHGLEVLPAKDDKGTIVFERDKGRGHWQYYPAKPENS